MRYISVCSGIEAVSVAWHNLFQPRAFCEFEAFPSAVLAHHYPDVPNMGDLTKWRDWPKDMLADADILVGGTPCQAFSVAGLRASLADDRGNLSLEFVRLANAIDAARSDARRDPGIVLWENVPGVLSVKDNAFGCFLAALAGEDTPLVPTGGKWTNAGVVIGPARSIAWRILDAQYFGLAQRRRRVFVVASARKGFDPAAVLLEFEGLRRDSPPRRETRQDPAARAAPGADECRSHWDGIEHPHPTLNQSFNTGAIGYSNQELFSQRGAGLVGEPSTGDVSHCLNAGGMGRQDYETKTLITHALRGEGFDGSEDGTGRGTPLVPVAFSSKDHGADASEDLSPTLRAMPHHGSHANGGGQMAVAIPLQEVGKRTGVPTEDPRAGIGIGVAGDPMFTLQAGAQHGVATAIPFDTTQITSPSNYSRPKDGDPCHPLAAGVHPPAVAVSLRGREGGGTAELGGDIQNALRASQGGGDKPHVLAAVNVQASQSGIRLNDTAGTLDANYGSRRHNGVMAGMAVRRLTPVECERLQGFPDNYTNIPWRNKPEAPDGPRYKALGNSMAVPVMRWIGTRIEEAINAQRPNDSALHPGGGDHPEPAGGGS